MEELSRLGLNNQRNAIKSKVDYNTIMVSKTGEKTGGRKKGVPNKKTADVVARLEAMNCDPIEGMVNLARGDAKCLQCDGGRVTLPKYYRMIRKAMPDPEGGKTLVDMNDEITLCPNCGGTNIEPIDAQLSGNMYKELAQYTAPKRKAIDHTGKVDIKAGVKWAIQPVKPKK